MWDSEAGTPRLYNTVLQIVDLKDSGKHPELSGKTYKQMYREIRGAVDLCHRDGSLKVAVASNPAKYIHEVRPAPMLAAPQCPG